jgi:hypothetical protein
VEWNIESAERKTQMLFYLELPPARIDDRNEQVGIPLLSLSLRAGLPVSPRPN